MVYKSNFIVEENEKYVKNESCSLTNIIKLKVGKISLKDIELIIFVDINDSSINVKWTVDKLSIRINALCDIKPDNIVNYIDANKFISQHDEINI